MTWLEIICVGLVVLVNAYSSTGVILTKNRTPRPTTALPSISGSGSISEVIEALPASVPVSGSGSMSFAEAFNALSASRPGSRGPSQASGSFSSSSSSSSSSSPSVGDISVTVSSGSTNYSAKVTVGTGTAYEIATPLTAKSSVVQVYRNWVGTRSVQTDSACWREAHIMDVCPSNYDRNEATSTCWAECPIEFPVKCGMECIRQNDDCGREVLYKISSIVNVGLNGIMDNWFGKFADMAKGIRTAVKCSCMLISEIRALNRYVRSIMTSDPEATQDEILAMLYQSNAVAVELPITIKMCLGKDVAKKWWLADRIMGTVQFLLALVLTQDDYIISSWDRFKTFLKSANITEPPEHITEGEIGYLKDALQSNSTCRHDLQGLVERTWATVETLREQNPGITKDELRVRIQDTDLVKTDIAIVTSNCMEVLIYQTNEETAYKTRDKLRKTFGVIINDLITTGTSNNGTTYKALEYAYNVVNQGLNFWVVTGFDMSGISSAISEYFQAICGPTQFMGEIDDGTEPETLGLNTTQKAFKNSTMSWTRKGDGQVIINFNSTDTESVTVNIMSGGDKVDEVDVVAGGSAVWKSTIENLGGKTLYLDRWRPGFLGLPGTGGGSLMLWVPHAAQGGHLELNAKLNIS